MKKSYVIIPLLTVIVMIAGVVLYVGSSPNSVYAQKEQSFTARAETVGETIPENVQENIYTDTSGILLANGSVAEDELVTIETDKNISVLKTISPVYYDTPDKSIVPVYYHEVEIPGINTPVYAFTNNTGNTEIRVYGTRWILENNIKNNSITGFFRQEVEKTNNGVIIKDLGEQEPVTDAKEKLSNPKRKLPEGDISLPENYIAIGDNLYKCYDMNDGFAYRTWAEINGNYRIYPCSANGNIERGAIPVNYNDEAVAVSSDEESDAGDEFYRYPGIITEVITLTVKQ